MIILEDVSKVYEIGGCEVRALDHASMHIREGEFVSIIGPSGSGKSTMMNIIGCLDTADSGQYRLDGQPIESYSEKELARIRNQKIGFIFQSFNLIGNLTAEENVEEKNGWRRHWNVSAFLAGISTNRENCPEGSSNE